MDLKNLSYNLIDEKWICAVENNEKKYFSLKEIFENAHNITKIYDDFPLVEISIYRFLIAILHRNFGPKNMNIWGEMFSKGKFDSLDEYFNKWHDRFDLFNKERPFYQALEENFKVEKDCRSINKIIINKSSGNNETLFNHNFDKNTNPVKISDIPKHLITIQGYGGGGRGYQFGLFNHGALIFLNGKNLFESLVLNLLIYNRENPQGFYNDENDKPSWELENPIFIEKEKSINGYLEYLTWQNKKIKLMPFIENNEIFVKDILYSQGNKKGKDNKIKDPMMIYIPKKNKEEKYILNFSEDRMLWRDSFSIIESLRVHDNILKSIEQYSLIKENLDFYPLSIYGGVYTDAFKTSFKVCLKEEFNIPKQILFQDEYVEYLKLRLKTLEDAFSHFRKIFNSMGEFVSKENCLATFWFNINEFYPQLINEIIKDPEGSNLWWKNIIYETMKNIFDKEIENVLSSSKTDKYKIYNLYKNQLYSNLNKILKDEINE